MPVTFHPSAQPLTPVSGYTLQYRTTKNPHTILAAATRREISTTCKEIFQSSFGDESKFVFPSNSGFVYAALHAYNAHQRLAKKELEVTAAGSRYTVDFGNLAEQMGHLIQKNVIDPSLREWIIPDFTTTTSNDRIVSSVVMMATLKAYFSYKMSTLCGLPAVTLLGEREDWQKLLTRLDKLPSFGKETSQWATLLKPVLTRFVSTFDQPESKENKDFWQTIVHHQVGGSGPNYLSGWITAFCFFSADGKVSYQQTERREKTEFVLDGLNFHWLDTKDIPAAYAQVDVKLNDNGEKFDTSMVAGMVGYRVPTARRRRTDTMGRTIRWSRSRVGGSLIRKLEVNQLCILIFCLDFVACSSSSAAGPAVLQRLSSQPKSVHFFSFHLGDTPSTTYKVMQPLFNSSLERHASRWPQVFANYSYAAWVNPRSILSAGLGIEASIGLMRDIFAAESASLADPQSLAVFFAPGNDDDKRNGYYGDGGGGGSQSTVFRRPWGLRPSSSSDDSVTNRNRFPSTVSLATADIQAYGSAVLALMQYYGWKSIAIIRDELNGNPMFSRNYEQCRGPLDQLNLRRAEFESLLIVTDFNKENFTRALTAAGKFSRIILSCTFGEQQRRVMGEAFDLNMTTGDFVSFIYDI
ncbi:hypothetical protein BV898_06496 [Hypsibius exemplaris]|uniref:Receptor ligand binding region domain-containing protein n=1 Tax=Hypsibius exemplaris TaxID=2072580 RepID=A0A1W0WWE0_HYPEX|nr:hypothetical protein BV898_06496 [Hypsibius exemplaris]